MVVFDAASVGSMFVRRDLSIAKRVPANESTLVRMSFFFLFLLRCFLIQYIIIRPR